MTTDVLAERARIEQQVEGRTLVDALADTVRTYPDEPAYSDKHHVPEGEAWRTLTWTETRELALDVAAGLVELGLAVGDSVAIMATNRIEHYVADIGAVHAAATPMSIYNTLSPEQVAYVAGHAQPAVAVLENADQLARWTRALDETESLKKVVVLDADALPEGDRFMTWDDLVAAGAAYRSAHADEIAARGGPAAPRRPGDDPVHLGHHREPQGRGAHPPQRALRIGQHARGRGAARRADRGQLPAARAHRRTGPRPLRPADRRAATCTRSATPPSCSAALGEVHPTSFFGVPRVWEKIKTGISAKLAADPNPDNVTLVQDSMAAGLAWVEAQERRRHDDPGDRGGLPPGRRGHPRVPQAAARARPAELGRVRRGADAARGREVHGRARDHGLRRLRHDRDLWRDHRQRTRAASSSARSGGPRRAWR